MPDRQFTVTGDWPDMFYGRGFRRDVSALREPKGKRDRSSIGLDERQYPIRMRHTDWTQPTATRQETMPHRPAETNAMDIQIRLMTLPDLPAFHAHFKRHRAESGTGNKRFMPYAAEDTPGPRGPDPDAQLRRTDQQGWQRWFCALDGDSIVGHVDLVGDRLIAGLHRCELGIGIEQRYRGRGLGKDLLKTAIKYAENLATVEWVDLRVFAHNRAAIKLYESVGFVEVAVQLDRFRVGGDRIDDVMMKLSVT